MEVVAGQPIKKFNFFRIPQSLYWRPSADQKARGLWVRDRAALKREKKQSKYSSPTQASTEYGSDCSFNATGSFEDKGDDSQLSEGIT